MQALRLSVCLIAMLSSIVLGVIWKTSHEQFDSGYPRIQVPVASNSAYLCSWVGSVVSLSREGKWIHEHEGALTKDKLRSALVRDRARLLGLGLDPSIRVRIARNAPARHFLELQKLAVECGYNHMIVSVVRPKWTPRKF